jgi:hypothetical protein
MGRSYKQKKSRLRWLQEGGANFFTALEQTPMRPQTKRWLQTLKHKDGPGYRTFSLYISKTGLKPGMLSALWPRLWTIYPVGSDNAPACRFFPPGSAVIPIGWTANTAWGRLFFQGLTFALGIENEL